MANNQWYMQQLKQPIRAGAVGLSPAEASSKYGLAKRQIRGGTQASMEMMKSKMGGAGFRAGESGIADSAMGQIASQGAEREGAAATQFALEDVNRAQELKAQTAGLNVQRATGAGQIGVGFAQAGAQRAAARMAQETAAARLGWEQEKFKDYEMPYTQEKDAWGRLMQLYGSQTQGQDRAWGEYGQYY